MAYGVRERMLAVAAPLTIAFMVVLVAAQAVPQATQPLDTWRAVDGGTQDPETFQLGPDDHYEKYTFRLAPANEVPVAVAFVKVENSHGDTVCSGPLTHQGTLNVHRSCDGLRPGHTYTLTWITDRPGNELGLWGARPL